LKIEVLGAQDEKIFVEFSTKQLAGLGIDRAALVSALQAQNIVIPSGTIQTGDEKLLLRVSGAFDSEASILAVNFVANGRLIRLRDIAQVRRTYADPPQPKFRVNGEPVDDAMTTIDVMTTRLAEGDNKVRAATFAYETLAFPMLTGSFVTAAAFVPIGFARSSAGEYTFSIFAVVSIALIASWFIAVIFGPLLGVALLTKPKETKSGKPSVIMGLFRGFLVGAMRARWLTIAATIGCLVLAFLALPHVPRQFFPSRCQTDARFHSANSRPSISSRNIH
jgi:multidrug efflux pump subunit AcrB